jgi:HEPN domain-containing protein
MKTETSVWLEVAQEDYRSIDVLLAAGNYRGAVVFAQQAVEKILKAYCVEFLNRQPRRTHRIERLIEETGLDTSAIRELDASLLSKAYIRARYPDLNRVHHNTRAKVEVLVSLAKIIYLWVAHKFENH